MKNALFVIGGIAIVYGLGLTVWPKMVLDADRDYQLLARSTARPPEPPLLGSSMRSFANGAA